jgi:hypothetical protein
MALDLEQALIDLSESIEFPSEDDLARRVVARLAEGERRSEVVPILRRPIVRRVLAVAVAAILILGIVLAISPRARRVAADLLGIGGIEIRSSPSSAPGIAPPTFPTTLVPGRLGLGSPVELGEGAERLGIVAPVPARLGPPSATYFGTTPADGELTLIWPPGPQLPATRIPGVGAMISVFRADLDQRYFEKALEPGTTYERVSIHGRPAAWLAGAPHRFIYPVDNGNGIGTEQLRLAGNTLIWANGGFTYRVESALARDAAIAVAESIPT